MMATFRSLRWQQQLKLAQKISRPKRPKILPSPAQQQHILSWASSPFSTQSTPTPPPTTAPPPNHNLYRLIYFNVRGAVEPIRYLLALANAPYEDVRYPMKATASGFGADITFQRDKDAGKFARNMNRLPILQILDAPPTSTTDATTTTESLSEEILVVGEIGQSHTISRFLAERHGLFGKDLLERAWIDASYESVRDIRSRYLNAKMTKTLSERTEWMNQKLPRFCRMLEASLPPSTTTKEQVPWLIGSEASLADIAVYSMLGCQTSILTGGTVNFFDGMARDLIQKAYADCPRLIQSVKATGALPAIQKWEKVRPDTFN